MLFSAANSLMELLKAVDLVTNLPLVDTVTEQAVARDPAVKTHMKRIEEPSAQASKYCTSVVPSDRGGIVK